ncbi:hypothetical protein V5O48_014652 [Marasmius crinis-equi]|uniref:Uncharacterized protein n=1 Tax=Marasmius crinis-equi TaxID=585013 RepID=A0ABR3EWQ2_9AGAR
MPRPKIYKNQEERKLAARAKARRHYEKNSATIKERKKVARLKYLKELEQQEIAERHERRRQRLLHRQPQMDEESQLQQTAKDTRTALSFFNSQYSSLKSKLLNSILKPMPLMYFEDVYQQLVAQLSLDEPIENPLQTARGSFEYRIGGSSVDQLWSDVWNDIGSGPLLNKFSALRDAFRSIEQAFNDMEVALLEGHLLDTHERRGFMYQSSVFLKTFQDLP